jgi:HEAT repeat protein
MQSRRPISLVLVLTALAAAPAAAQDKPKDAPPPPSVGIQPKGPKDTGKGPKIKMGTDSEPAPAPTAPPSEGDQPKSPVKTEPEQWMDLLATWPAAEAKQASIRLSTVPAVSYPLLERKMLEANQDWRIIAGSAATLGKIRDLRAIDLIRAKLDDRKMYQHASDLVEAIVRIDPVGAKPRLFALLLHPASAVVFDVEKFLAPPRIAATDLDALRDVFDAAGPAGRAAALRLMTAADPVASRPDVVKALRDAEPDVAFAAAQSLAADDSPEALALTLKSMTTPIDRQFAYCAISLALRTERSGVRIADDSVVRTLLGGRGIKSLDRLAKTASALLLADLGYFHDVPMLDETLDRMVVPILIDSWVSPEFWADQKVAQPLVLRRLRRLTGRTDLNQPQEWAAWWEQEGIGFTARRVLIDVPPEAAITMVLSVDGASAPGGETTTITASADLIGAQAQDELTLLVPLEDATLLAKAVDESGVLRVIDGSQNARDVATSVTVTVRAGRREKRTTLRSDALTPGTEKLLAAVADVRSRQSWQRYRTSGNALDAQSFVAVMAKSFSPERSAEQREASLASLIVQALDDRRGEAWNLRALHELESLPHLSTALSAEDTDRLLAALGRRKTLDPVAQGIVRAIALAKKPEATPLLLDFLVTRGTPEARALLVTVLANAPRDQYLAALGDDRYEVRLASFTAADAATLGDAGTARILKAVDDKDRVVAAEALRAVGRLRIEQARPLIEHLAEADSDLRPAAVEALGLLGGRESLSTIMTAYTSDDQGLRVAAIQALASTREPEGISAIVFAMSGDPSSLVREVASRAVVDIGTDRAATELRKLAIDPAQPPGPRANALVGYAQIAGRGAMGDLAKLVAEPSDEVADAAALALSKWRDAAAVPHLIVMLEKDRSPARARQALEAISLESFGNQKDPNLLADLYGGWWELSKDRGPKRWLLDAITADGTEDAALRSWAEGDSGKQVVPSLLKALRHEKWYIRRAADVALRDLLGKKVGDQDPWTTPGDVSRMADAWEKIWAESLGK